MADSLEDLLRDVDSGTVPPVVLVGGDNGYLVDHAFHAIRDRIMASDPSIAVEPFSETADLAQVVDSFRTHSLFGGRRLLVLPEVNAFVTVKEIASLVAKAVGDWDSAKTDRKRSSATAKLLHAVGLVGLDLESSDREIADALGAEKGARESISAILEAARLTGKRVSRGEGDAALVAEAAAGGAPGSTLLMKTGEIPRGSATVEAIRRNGAVIVCNLTREDFRRALDQAIAEISEEYGVAFDGAAATALRDQLGIERVLADKRSKEIPDLRQAVSEATRLAGFVGRGGKVTGKIVRDQIAAVAGGQRYEFASLVTEGKTMEAIAKLRDLVGQARREDPKTGSEIVYGRFLFSLAEEIRQILGIVSYCRSKGLDPRRPMQYNRFKDALADEVGDYLIEQGLARRRQHPFPLYRKYEAAGRFSEARLIAALDQIAELEFARKSGGVPAEIRLETIVSALGM